MVARGLLQGRCQLADGSEGVIVWKLVFRTLQGEQQASDDLGDVVHSSLGLRSSGPSRGCCESSSNSRLGRGSSISRRGLQGGSSSQVHRGWFTAVAGSRNRPGRKGVPLHSTRICASLPGLLPHRRCNHSPREGSGGGRHDGGHLALFLPPGTVWGVSRVGAATVDAPGPLAVRVSCVGPAAADAAVRPAARLPYVAIPTTLLALQRSGPGWPHGEAYAEERHPLRRN